MKTLLPLGLVAFLSVSLSAQWANVPAPQVP